MLSCSVSIGNNDGRFAFREIYLCRFLVVSRAEIRHPRIGVWVVAMKRWGRSAREGRFPRFDIDTRWSFRFRLNLPARLSVVRSVA